MKAYRMMFPYLAALILAGCSSSRTATDIIKPRLLYQQPFPVFTAPLAASVLRLPFEIYVTKAGSVSDVVLLAGSGDVHWDSATVQTIKQWQFEPAHAEGRPIGIWLRQTAVIRFSEPRFLLLAEIVCRDEERIDSVYRLLRNGGSFPDAAVRFSDAPSRTAGGRLGTVNILNYPEEVQRALIALGKNECTAPLHIGSTHVIFLRLQE